MTKLISWNVNGIRANIKKGLLEKIEKLDPDILCIQETKAQQEQVNLELPGFLQYWNSAEKKGYSGTAIFTRREPIQVAYDLGIPKHDREGRVITLEYSNYYLVTVYTPNVKRSLERLPYRCQEWDVDFLAYLKQLEQKKPVLFCGDLNVAHQPIDLANPQANVKNAGFTPEERRGFDNIIQAGFIDTFREFHKDGGHYTWWSHRSGVRERNIGWRIDYFCLSLQLRPYLKDSFILPDVPGSDHCPIGVLFDFPSIA